MKGEIVSIILVFSFCLASVGASREVEEEADECPLLWTINRNGSCVCGSSHRLIIKCNPQSKSLSIRMFYCMTADSNFNAVVATCLYNGSANLLHAIKYADIYSRIKSNTTLIINRETCGFYKRKGFMCGQCIKDYGLPVYSYDISCVECLDYKYNWLKYIAVAYLPLTVFCFFIVICRISANSGLLVGYITVSQMMSTYSLSQLYVVLSSSGEYARIIVRVAIMLYSVWNLDFFRSVYPSFCLHPNMSALGILSLDYLVAICPIAAVLITYFVYQKFSYATCLSRPSLKFLHFFKKKWNVRNSLIEAFATLLLLSHVKILNVSFNILMPIYIYGMHGTMDYLHVLNDPPTVYLSKQHLPYVILAISMSFVFCFLPILLMCLYSCKRFHKCLDRIGLQHPTLATFMDAFQGSYKHEPYYLRSFPAIYFVVQFSNLLILACFRVEQYHQLAALNLMVIIILVATARPYKNVWHNMITLSLFSTAFVYSFSMVLQLNANILVVAGARWKYFLQCFTYVASFVPPLYGLILFLRGVLLARIIMKVRTLIKKNRTNDQLPYRFECDQENTPLLGPNT